MKSNRLDRFGLVSYREAVEEYEALSANLRQCLDVMRRAEQRIGLLAAMIALEGGEAELPNDLEPRISQRLMAQINKWATR